MGTSLYPADNSQGDVLVVEDLIAVRRLSKTRGVGAAKQRLESLKFAGRSIQLGC